MKQQQMSKLLKGLMLNAAGVSAVAVGSIALMPGEASAAISATKHNLGQTTITTQNRVTSTGGVNLDQELCVFCHTPHGSASAGAAPLWNKKLPTTTYTPYSSGSMDQTVTSGDIAGGNSIACLSCHDGTQGMDSMINAPGSGNFTSGGADAGFSWAGPRVSADGVMGAGIALLGSDLSNDHPIGIFYCANTAAMTSGATTNCGDRDFDAPTRVGTSGAWFIDIAGGTAGTKEKTDIQLFGRTGALDRPRVECGSCHDPHTSNQTFLRTTNTSSRVCLACHDK